LNKFFSPNFFPWKDFHPISIEDFKKQQESIHKEIYNKVVSFIIAGLFYIIWRLPTFESDPHPYFKIFLEQMNGASSTINDLANDILKLELTQDNQRSILRLLLNSFEKKPIVGFDEFQVFSTERKKVILKYSKREEITSTSNLDDYLYPLNHSLQQIMSELNIVTVFSGTQFTFSNLEALNSSYHIKAIHTFTDFDSCLEPKKFIAEMIGVNENELSCLNNDDLAYYKGRYRSISFLFKEIISKLKHFPEINNDNYKFTPA